MNIDELLKSSNSEEKTQHAFMPILLERLNPISKLERKEYLMSEKLEDFCDLFSEAITSNGGHFGYLKNEQAEIKDLYNVPLYELVVALYCLPKMQQGTDNIIRIARDTVNENVYVDVDFI